MASWTALPPFQVQQLTSVSRFDQLLDNVTVVASHAHTGAAGQGASAISVRARGTNAMLSAPRVEFSVFPFIPASQSNWDRIAPCPVAHNGGYIKTSVAVSASGACIAWPVMIASAACGTGWGITFGCYTDEHSGCMAGCINGSPLAFTGAGTSTISIYSAAAASTGVNANSIANASFNGASGVYVIRLQVVGQSTCSDGYHAGVSYINLSYT